MYLISKIIFISKMDNVCFIKIEGNMTSREAFEKQKVLCEMDKVLFWNLL